MADRAVRCQDYFRILRGVRDLVNHGTACVLEFLGKLACKLTLLFSRISIHLRMSRKASPGVEAALAGELATSMGKDCGGTEKDEPTEERPKGKVWIGISRLDDGRLDSTSDYDTVNTSTARIPSRRLSWLDLALSR